MTDEKLLQKAIEMIERAYVPYSHYRVGAALLRREYDPDAGACVLGDIIISMDHVRAQAKEYGHSEQRETGYLLTHGLFHLMGYDHMTDADKPVMRAMEERALASIGLTREE